VAEKHAIVGARVEDLASNPIKGSIEEPCRDCEQPTWVSPATREAAGEGAPVICTHCFLDIKDNDRDLMALTPDQWREFLREMFLRRD